MKEVKIDLLKDKVHEECGVFGIYNNDNLDLVSITKDALFALQHRGQASCGIAVNDGGEFKSVKSSGLVAKLFDKDEINTLPNGKISIGHVRYHSEDVYDIAGAQPLVIRYIQGSLAIAQNGAITNYVDIRKNLEEGGAIFQS
ncbi:MAG: amidophosphoribosyltransferase, partial [Acutalibacteraceae bacterium]